MTIVERLEGGERLVLDGGTGSELQHRGVDVLQQVYGDEFAADCRGGADRRRLANPAPSHRRHRGVVSAVITSRIVRHAGQRATTRSRFTRARRASPSSS